MPELYYKDVSKISSSQIYEDIEDIIINYYNYPNMKYQLKAYNNLLDKIPFFGVRDFIIYLHNQRKDNPVLTVDEAYNSFIDIKEIKNNMLKTKSIIDKRKVSPSNIKNNGISFKQELKSLKLDNENIKKKKEDIQYQKYNMTTFNALETNYKIAPWLKKFTDHKIISIVSMGYDNNINITKNINGWYFMNKPWFKNIKNRQFKENHIGYVTNNNQIITETEEIYNEFLKYINNINTNTYININSFYITEYLLYNNTEINNMFSKKEEKKIYIDNIISKINFDKLKTNDDLMNIITNIFLLLEKKKNIKNVDKLFEKSNKYYTEEDFNKVKNALVIKYNKSIKTFPSIKNKHSIKKNDNSQQINIYDEEYNDVKNYNNIDLVNMLKTYINKLKNKKK